eukprot:2285153-Alexandrium_andersonii.AAC.1
MSASLVGSEMCIRDSRRVVGAGVEGGGDGLVEGVTAVLEVGDGGVELLEGVGGVGGLVVE